MEEVKYCSLLKPEQSTCAKCKINGPLSAFCPGKSHHPFAAGTLGCQKSSSAGKFLKKKSAIGWVNSIIARRAFPVWELRGSWKNRPYSCIYPVAEVFQASGLSDSRFPECVNH